LRCIQRLKKEIIMSKNTSRMALILAVGAASLLAA
jgi:hypothetical protein